MGAAIGIMTGVLSAVSGIAQASAQANAMERQAAMQQQVAAAQAERLREKARQERISGNRQIAQKDKEERLAKSRNRAFFGASGFEMTSGTFGREQNLIEDAYDLQKRMSFYNAQSAANGLKDQANLTVWAANEQASSMRAAAQSTRVGGVMSAVGAVAGGAFKTFGNAALGGTENGSGVQPIDVSYRDYG